MKAVSKEKMQDIDRQAIKRFGISRLILTEIAGLKTFELADKILKKRKNKKVAVFCGKGYNGCDGLVCARYLFNSGYKVIVYVLSKFKDFSKEALINLNILKELGINIKKITKIKDLCRLKREIENCRLLIDAIFGIGVRGNIKEPVKSLIGYINMVKKPILSLDIPSGLDSNTGKILGECIRADFTITFGLCKKGLVKKEAKQYTGKIEVADIGIPRELTR